MAGTSWVTFVADTKARAEEVNNNFDWLEGTLTPMTGGNKTTGVFDLGELSYNWNDVHVSGQWKNNLQLPQTKRVIFDADEDSDTYIYESTTDEMSFIIGGSNRIRIRERASISSYLIEALTTASYSVIQGNKYYVDGGNDTYLYSPGTGTFRFICLGSFGAQIGPTEWGLASGQKLYFDGISDTYMHESTANTLDFVTGGTNTALRITADGDIRFEPGKKLYFTSNNADYIYRFTTDQIRIVTGSATRAIFDSTLSSIETHFKLNATKRLYLDGGSNTYIYEKAGDVMQFVVGGNEELQISSGDNVCRFNNSLIPGLAGTYNLGDTATYWATLHYQSAEIHSITEPNESNPLSKIVAIKDLANKEQYPKEVLRPAKSKDGTPALKQMKLMGFILKSLQQIDKRLTTLEK